MPTKIAWILDDDEFILRALQRTLKRICHDWQLELFSDPSLFLQALASAEKPHLVICDRVMPEYSGEQILSQVRFQAPIAVRVLLTADTEADVVAEDCRDIHHFLGKPFTETDLLQVFQCAEQLQMLPLTEHCRHELGSQNHLPILPAIFRALQQQTQKDSSTHQDLADIIAQDGVLAGKIMQLANSPFLGFSRKTTALVEAVSRLGFRMVESIACILYSEQAFSRLISTELHQHVMHQANQIAGIARQLAKLSKQSLRIQDLVFISALLRSLGILTLLAQGRVLAEASTDTQLQQPQADYLIISVYILTLWGFEPAISQCLLHDVQSHPSEEPAICALLIHLAQCWFEQQECPTSVADEYQQAWLALQASDTSL